MNQGPFIVVGLFFAVVASWCAFVFGPMAQLGREQPETPPQRLTLYPGQPPGEAHQGREVYRSLGCAECHTMLVRPKGLGGDQARGWGKRRTVARDYLYEKPLLLGEVRVGPDLANLAERLGATGTNLPTAVIEKELRHLYNPRCTTPGSLMPSYAFLFEKRKVGEPPSRQALKLAGDFAPEPGYEIVPKPEAEQLVAYLMSLHSQVSLEEAPIPQKKTVAASKSTRSTPSTNAVTQGKTTNNPPATP